MSKEPTAEKDVTTCGRAWEHDWHIFRSERGKTMTCDGVFRSSKARVIPPARGDQ